MNRQEEPMTLEEFRRLLDVHGAADARWPADVRATARALLLKDAQARALLEEARALEVLLAEDAVPPASAELQRRIMEAAGIGTVGQGGPAAANDNDAKPWWMVVPMAASLLLGVWLGFSGTLAPVQEVFVVAADAEVASIMEIAAPVDDEGDLL